MPRVKPETGARSAVRSPGRPRDPAKAEAIVDASWRMFLAHGVKAVTIDAIAAEAGVAKMTVYAHFPDKRAIFAAGVRREMAKIEAAQAVMPEVAASLRDVLIAFGIGIMTFLTSPGAVDFYSQLAGELRRDPDLARLFYEAGPGRTHANLAAILSGPLGADLQMNDPEAAAEMLFGMWQGLSNYQLMLGIAPEQVLAGIPRKIPETVDYFLMLFQR